MFTYCYNLVLVYARTCVCVVSCDLTAISKFMSKEVGEFSSFPPNQTNPVAPDHPCWRDLPHFLWEITWPV